MKKEKHIILILVILLVITLAVLAYLAVGKYTESKQRQQLTIFQQGAQLGYQQAVDQLIQQAVTCQQVPISFQNTTINLIAVECLQQPAAQQTQ